MTIPSHFQDQASVHNRNSSFFYQGDDRIARVHSDRQRLPGFLRPLHRALTAVPDSDADMPRRSPLGLFAFDMLLLGKFGAAAGTGGILLASGSVPEAAIGLPLAVYGALGVIGRLRRFVVGHNHEASHGASKRWYMSNAGWSKSAARRANEAIMDIATAVTFTTNGQDYRRDHGRHHRLDMLGTLNDPDGAQLQAWGFWGEMKPGEFSRHLLLTVFSPRWHAGFLLARLRSNLFKGKRYRRGLGLVSLLSIGSLAMVMPIPAWIAAVLIPWTWGYQTASLLQVLTRHNYPHASGAGSWKEYSERTWERIPWTPLPSADLAGKALVKAWTAWVAELLLIHLPSRLAVLDTTMVWHGYHHMAWPVGRPFEDWWNVGYQALLARSERTMAGEGASRVLWGLPEALRLQARRMQSPLR